MMRMKSFEELGLSADTLKTIKAKGFEEPSPIQEQTIPVLMKGEEDIIGQAQTGTGKTAAFGLPLVELLDKKAKHVQALILTPTRELAIQVAEEINSLKGKRPLSIVPIYGGQAISLQLRSLKKGVDIVVGTPGRVMDHLKRGSLTLSSISHLVLDEADEMLNMGFLEDVKAIMEHTSADKRMLLFSATMPRPIMEIARKYMRDYKIFKVTPGELTSSRTEQIYFEVTEANKFEALCRIIDVEEEFFGMVFCRTKVNVSRVAKHLTDRGYQADGLHGDITQSQREKILNNFKKRRINILVATDVAARGIDVQDISHVINYALPQDPEAYVHRIGRTGRAGKTGHAITFVTPAESRKLKHIQQKAKTDIRRERLPEVKDIIQLKRQRVRSRIDGIIDVEPKEEYRKLAAELLSGKSPEVVLGALLQHTFQGEINEAGYTEIAETTTVDKGGKTRLFVGIGKNGGMTSKKLIKIVNDLCGVSLGKIHDIQIREKCAFISLPFQEAEQVLDFFQKSKNRSAMYVTKAKKEGPQGRPQGRPQGKPQ
ncbi:MAG: DEAD/DEAH box helicase, partial [Candidatus Omnitrophica bacterium]|nr:DEAD/DEAH box helicase [Candidatus Omnitrophota bacterium]